jgi:hypothetical protein
MFSERKMGTPARLMATKSVKSDQPTIKASRPYASGYVRHHRQVATPAKSINKKTLWKESLPQCAGIIISRI